MSLLKPKYTAISPTDSLRSVMRISISGRSNIYSILSSHEIGPPLPSKTGFSLIPCDFVRLWARLVISSCQQSVVLGVGSRFGIDSSRSFCGPSTTPKKGSESSESPTGSRCQLRASTGPYLPKTKWPLCGEKCHPVKHLAIHPDTE